MAKGRLKGSLTPEDVIAVLEHVELTPELIDEVRTRLKTEGIPWVSCYPTNHINNALGEEGVPILMMGEERFAVAVADGFGSYTALVAELTRRRREWFSHEGLGSHLVLWWIPAGTLPTLDEARDFAARVGHPVVAKLATPWVPGSGV